MAWDRRLELIIGPGDEGLVISGLDIDFKVRRSVAFAENTAEFTVYNASENTRSVTLKKGNSVSFSAGYEDQSFGVIFIGQVLESKSWKERDTWVSIVTCSMSAGESESLSRNGIALTYAPGTSSRVVLQEIATFLGLVLFGVENVDVDLPILPNGYAYAGTARGALHYARQILRNKGIGLYIDNATLVVYSFTGSSNFNVAYLSKDSGLIDAAEEERSETDQQRLSKKTVKGSKKKVEKKGADGETRKYISFTSLLNPRVKPNTLVEIDSQKVKGNYLIHFIDFYGNNYGGDFNCKGEAVS